MKKLVIFLVVITGFLITCEKQEDNYRGKAEIIGFDVPWQMDGVSLLSEEQKGRLEKRILQGQGRKVHLFKTDHEAKYKSLQQKLEWFGEGPDENEVFRPLVQTSRLTDIRLMISALHDSLSLDPRSDNPVE